MESQTQIGQLNPRPFGMLLCRIWTLRRWLGRSTNLPDFGWKIGGVTLLIDYS